MAGALFKWRSIMVGGRGEPEGLALKGLGSSARMADCLRASVRFQTSSVKASSWLWRHFLWNNTIIGDIVQGNKYDTDQEVNHGGQNTRGSENCGEYTASNNTCRCTADRSGRGGCTWGDGRGSTNSRLIRDCLDEGEGRRRRRGGPRLKRGLLIYY